jgi:type VI secretion system protein ImpL
LHEHFGIRFPIYVLFTKADLIAGFIEFFNDLGQEERAQVWGMTLPMDDPTAIQKAWLNTSPLNLSCWKSA